MQVELVFTSGDDRAKMGKTPGDFGLFLAFGRAIIRKS